MYFSQLANRSSALSIREKGSGHPEGQDQSRQCLFHWGWTWSHSVRPATMEGAPAKRIDARQDSSNEWRTASPEVSHTPSNTAVERSQVFGCGHVGPYILLQRERGGRETLCPTCDSRKPKHRRTLVPSSALTGRPKTAKKEGSRHRKGPAQNPFLPFSIGAEARSTSVK